MSELFDLSRDSHHILEMFCEGLVELKLHLDKLKLPRSTSKEFFYELASELNKECICGTILDKEKRGTIIEKADEYLAEDDTGILNSIKSDIGQIANYTSSYYREETKKAIDELDSAIRLRDKLDAEKRALEKSLTEGGSEELKDIEAELTKIKAQLNKVESSLSELDRNPEPGDDDNSKCIKHIEKSLEDARDKYAEITSTIEIKNKCSSVMLIIEKAYNKSITTINKIITNETNVKMKSLLPLEPVTLSNIDNCLRLTGKEGASAGQTLALAYGFLSTLFSHGNHKLPFIIDSPAGALDLVVRKQVSKIVPILCDQFVAFIISSERENFTKSLESEAGSVQYITLFRKSEGTKYLLKKLPKGEFVEYKNSVYVEDKHFFYNFNLEEEA